MASYDAAGSLGLAPLSLLAGVIVPETREAILRGGLAATDRAGGWLFRPLQLAPTYHGADLTPFERFPINSYSAFVPSDADLANWRLYVDGLVSRPGTYTFDQVAAMPKVVQNVRHVCIEG